MTPPTPRTGSISVLLVDRDRLLRQGLCKLILERPRLEVVAESDSGTEAVSLARQIKPDVILLALDLGNESGFDVLSALPDFRVLVVAGERDEENYRRAMVLGAAGVVVREAGADLLFKAIEKVHSGEVWYDRAKIGGIMKEILQMGKRSPNPVATRIATLSAREHEVIALVSRGLRNRDIGDCLFISETTVRHHLTSVFEKLEVSNRLELIIFALTHKLATLPETADYCDNAGRKSVNLYELRQTM